LIPQIGHQFATDCPLIILIHAVGVALFWATWKQSCWMGKLVGGFNDYNMDPQASNGTEQ